MDRGYSPWRHKESDTTERLKLNLKYTIPSSSEFLLLPSQPAWIPCHLSYLLRSSPSPPSHFLHCTMWAGLPPFVLLPLSSLYTRSFYILSYLYITPSVSSTQYLEFTEPLINFSSPPASVPNKVFCFVSMCGSLDNAFPSVRQEPLLGPGKPFPSNNTSY